MTTSSLYPTHTINGPPVEQCISNTDSTTKTREGFQSLVKMDKNKKADIEYPSEHNEVINYILAHSYYKDTGDIPNSVSREDGNCQW